MSVLRTTIEVCGGDQDNPVCYLVLQRPSSPGFREVNLRLPLTWEDLLSVSMAVETVSHGNTKAVTVASPGGTHPYGTTKLKGKEERSR